MVRVTAADIAEANGAREERHTIPFLASRSCPIARAISRELGQRVLVDGTHFQLNKPFARPVPLPGVAIDFVIAWDNLEDVSPISFDL